MGQFNNVNNNITINDFKINNEYVMNQIVHAFKCQREGGMLRSIKTNTLVLIANHTAPLYDDKWIDGIFHYTGMGQRGDQRLNFSQNRTLNESHSNGVEVHLFESYKDGFYKYDGKVELAGQPYFVDELDANDEIRKVIKFPLRRLSNEPLIVKLDEIESSIEQKEKKLKKKNYDNKKLKELANKLGSENPKKSIVNSTVIDRNQAVIGYTKGRANGKCDLCGYDAPFFKNGVPYLECHHVIRLADNGPDTIYNTVALCPNCHRKIHILNKKSDLKVLKNKIKSYLENDSDIESLKKFKELFGE